MKWLNPMEWDVGVTLVALLVVGTVAALVLAPPSARSQTVHPDIMWLYRLIENLDSRVKLLEEMQQR
jgi:hypothetical protein